MPSHGSRQNLHNISSMPGYNPNLPPGRRGRNTPRNKKRRNRPRRTTRQSLTTRHSSRRTPQRGSSPVQRSRTRVPGRRSVSPRQSGVRRQIQSTSRYTFLDGTLYFGKVIEQNEIFYSTISGTLEASSRELSTKKP